VERIKKKTIPLVCPNIKSIENIFFVSKKDICLTVSKQFNLSTTMYEAGRHSSEFTSRRRVERMRENTRIEHYFSALVCPNIKNIENIFIV
jgi:hypothetical protein